MYFKIVAVLCTTLPFICPLVHFGLQDIDNCFKVLRSFQPLSLIFSDTRFDPYATARRRTLSEHGGRIPFFKRNFNKLTNKFPTFTLKQNQNQ